MISIISHFHDYYDRGLAFESKNNEIIYLRDENIFEIGRGIKHSPLIQKIIDNFYSNLKRQMNHFDWRFKQSTKYGKFEIDNGKNYFYQSLFNVIFCGKIYPSIKIRVISKNGDSLNYFFYDFNSYQNFIQKYELDFSDNKAKNIAENYFNLPISANQLSFLIENKISIVVIEIEKMIINGKLSNYEFYKLFDPYAAYQELDTWLGGVLAYPQNIMIEVEDKSKIVKHGFDNKYGFRTRSKKV
jgi:hypothetical protein